MTAQLKIDKGIPLPPRRYGALSKKAQPAAAVFEALAAKMSAGDSVLVTYRVAKDAKPADLWRASHRATVQLRKAIELRGMKAATRSERAGKIRVWALAK